MGDLQGLYSTSFVRMPGIGAMYRGFRDVTGIPVDHGDMMGMKVPCKLIFYGHRRFLHVLRAELVKKD